VRSIRDVGLKKAVVVTSVNLQETGKYELVCGEGRLLAYKKLGHTDIRAEIWSCDRNKALLCSLVENIVREPPAIMVFAREVKRMHDGGMSLAEIGTIVGKSEAYLRDFIRLVEQGEERLIIGVERGSFPIHFAVQVARSDRASIQHLLMDAFDSGLVNTANLHIVRKILDARFDLGKETSKTSGTPSHSAGDYSIKQLRSDIVKITKDKEDFVREAGLKESRVTSLLMGLHTLWKNRTFVTLVQVSELDKWPELDGTYNA